MRVKDSQALKDLVDAMVRRATAVLDAAYAYDQRHSGGGAPRLTDSSQVITVQSALSTLESLSSARTDAAREELLTVLPIAENAIIKAEGFLHERFSQAVPTCQACGRTS